MAAEGKTTFIISHRIGLCKMVYRIIVMKDGNITETGTHDELLSAGVEYKRLFNEQAKWYSASPKLKKQMNYSMTYGIYNDL
jgi:ATP-binding cassette subfamily B protein